MPLCFDYAENSRGLGLADMAKSIETGRPCRAGWQQTLHALEIMTAFERSSGKRAAVDLSTRFIREAPMKHNPLHGILD